LLAAGCATGPPGERIDTGLARLKAELERLERQGFVGQVAVAHAGEIVLLQGYGTIRPGGEQPVTAESVMPLASLTKPLTASAILALAADGKLSLRDPVGLHLEALDADWSDIPIERLLTHTAGLPAEIHHQGWPGDPRFEPIDRDTLIRRVNHFSPEPPPGSAFNYSNVGYNLLAAVIEAVSGVSWERFLHQRLLAPAGIEGIGLIVPEWRPAELVAGRSEGRDRGHYLERPRLDDGLGYNLRGAGDLLARPRGIVDWYRAVGSDRWLPEPWQARWLQPRVREPDGSRYGFGLRFRDSRWGPVIGHRGGDRLFATDLSWFTGPDIMVYIATADARYPADVLAPRLHRRLLGR
jgi:CubicO group peptidase (beta-lactamase class C family)